MLFIVDDCKKRWKNLRDTYRKEKKKEKERSRSGSEASSQRPWRYSQIMAFLDPFMEDRATSSNMPAGASQGEIESSASQASTETGSEEMVTLFLEQLSPEAEALSCTLTPTPISTPTLTSTSTSTPTPSTSRGRSRAQKRGHDDALSPFERQLMGAVDVAMAQAVPPDPDRQFFEGLLPELKGLSAQRKAEVKFKIHQIIFEATCQQFEEQE